MADRLPFEPLAEIAKTRWRPPTLDSIDTAGPVAHVRQMMGGRWDSATISRWRRGGLTSRSADAAACEAGMHPVNIWPDWFDRE